MSTSTMFCSFKYCEENIASKVELMSVENIKVQVMASGRYVSVTKYYLNCGHMATDDRMR